MRISNSFSEGEIAVMDFILTTLLRGGSAQMATRNKDFGSLCRKVLAMKQKVEEKHREDILKGRPTPEHSSVGEIAAVESADEALEDVG
ncbi:MAG: hypothetical protein M5U28_06505 [Sandaracinaceae bacterium]|nr:hypothetical protein [Sandaracinaceae bacterium]